MKRLLIPAFVFVLITVSSHANESESIDAARIQTVAWLALTDAGEYGASWDSASTLFQSAVSKEDWKKSLSAARTPLGALEMRDVATSKFTSALPGVPDGEYVVFQFNSSFKHKAVAVETVTAMKDTDGKWKVAGYFIK